MLNQTQQENTDIKLNNRPQSLSFICILSFIGSGISALTALLVLLIFDAVPALVEQGGLPQAIEMNEILQKAGKSFFAVMLVLYVASFFGVFQMWKQQKTGFHIYTLAQLLLLLVPLLMISGFTLPVSNWLLTLTFIGAYALNLRFMK